MCHVLIIEDDWLIADHIQQLVERAGASSIDMASTEEEAVALAGARAPAVIISDVNLAEGSGPVAFSRICSAIGDVPVMFVTGEPESSHARLPKALVLAKPVPDDILVSAFRSLAPVMDEERRSASPDQPSTNSAR
jgi:two-component system, response regulator PdtaR